MFRLILFLALLATGSLKTLGQNNFNIIPRPLEVLPEEGHFVFNSNTKIYVHADADFALAADYFIKWSEPAFGFKLKTTTTKADNNCIIIEKAKDITEAEGYKINITASAITIRAARGTGAFYALQSIRQLLPAESENRKKVSGKEWAVPCGAISDHPRYPYRGMHLDVCRHFFDVNTVKKYIDLMAMNKMNKFHWHLTDDQGWRIEIKKYPKLTQIGAYRAQTVIGRPSDSAKYDGKRYGGFYTQQQIKEVVEYARQRFITVIPEIEMPGHALAALAAYPELACKDSAYQVGEKWGIFNEVFCPEENTFTFLENVLTEVADLFPAPYIHIGGDECPKTAWEKSEFCQQLMKKEGLKNEHELQSYFINRIEKFLEKKGKKIIGWDEILEGGGLAPNATVMSWRGIKGGEAAAIAGHDVIMTPTTYCYFDYYQSQGKDEPLAIGGNLPLDKVYKFDPTPASLDAPHARYILGGQANMWTEYILDEDQLFYMAYPRACAMAEVLWSDKQSLNYRDFVRRLNVYLKRLDVMGINYSRAFADIKGKFINTEDGLQYILLSDDPKVDIYFTANHVDPTRESLLFGDPIPLERSFTLKAQGFKDNKKTGALFEKRFNINMAFGKQLKLVNQPEEKYGEGAGQALTNGIEGTANFGDGEWLGFSGKDFDGTIDLEKDTLVSSVRLRFFTAPESWIYLPRSVEIYTSVNGADFKKVATQDISSDDKPIAAFTFDIAPAVVRYVRIKVTRYGMIPDEKEGAGNEAWLFVDEIVVK